MDVDAGVSQNDQISLYGLFGDSTATLQGLNDHLSPSLLQQSPPCGSTLSAHSVMTTTVTTSPNKGIFTGAHQGVLLSDLADGSPSAGSVTVASLCNHVSFDNLRCTNLVNVKGNRFCSQHANKYGPAENGMLHRLVPSGGLQKSVGFMPPKTQLKIDRSNMASAMRTVKFDVKPVASGTLKRKSVDLPDSSSSSSKVQSPQVRVVRKLGQQISVTSLPFGVKEAETSAVNPAQTVSSMLNPLKTVTAKPNVSKTQPRIIMKSVDTGTGTHATKVVPYAMHTSTAKPNGMDEDVLKKVLEVLNSRNDLSSQQQISLLQSMGITVVHGSPSGGNLAVRKKKASKSVVRKVIKIGNAKHLKAASPNSATSLPGMPVTVGGFNPVQSSKSVIVNSSAAVSPMMRPPLMPSAMETLARQAVTAAQLPTLNKKVQPIVLPLKGDLPTVMESLARQAVKTSQLPEQNKGIGTKPLSKAAQKRKLKSSEAGSVKKSKSTINNCTQQYVKSVQQPPIDAKKVRPSKLAADRSKQAKLGVDGNTVKYSLLTASDPLRMLPIPVGASNSVIHLTEYLHEKSLLDYNLFETECIEVEKVEADKNKTLKAKLLQKHMAKKRKSSQSLTVFDYRECMKNMNGTDFFKTFSAAKALLDLLLNQKQGKKTIVHHETVLHDLLEQNDAGFEEFFEENMSDIQSVTITDDTEESEALTLQTMLVKNKYERLLTQLKQDEIELDMLFECYVNDPTSTRKLLNFMTGAKHDKKHNTDSTIVRKCHLSSDNGLSCNAPALPYSSYCKQHIWYCQSQRLYKLDQNMKPTADISPEPMVKKVRKRTKLLPLIKRYKKKKKKKVEGNDGHDSAKEDLKNSTTSLKQQVQNDARGTVPASVNNHSAQNILSPLVTRPALALPGNVKSPVTMDDSDIEDAKPSDTSEEDLNLTTNEIMLSGVLDKLPDDPHDFDLFTTDKGAEELERALMLASTSPTPDHEENKLDIRDFDSSLLSNAKLNDSPDAIVNCDAPKSNGKPPSLESFDKSQCVHYTFGSSLQPMLNDKTDNDTNGYTVEEEESAPPLISAEDLQEIEGVLEMLHAEDVNSPKLPSSPAVDQYTSMLARQLSQEAETESLKQQSSATGLADIHTSFNIVKESMTLSRSYSMPTTSIRDSFATEKSASVLKEHPSYQNGMVSNAVELHQQKSTVVTSGNASPTLRHDEKGTLSLQRSMSSNIQSLAASQDDILRMPPPMTQVSSAMSMARSVSTVDRPMQGTSKAVKRVTAASTFKVSSQAQISVSQRTPQPQPKISQSPNVVSNPVLPVTLMQSPQSGNVIKVIVPPGTMVNGSNGQQNMLLIPVSALMKQTTVAGNQNIPTAVNPAINCQSSAPTVKTQLSSLQAGQQFFIVNNNAGSAQTHLALLQKPGVGTTSQQGVFVKPNQKSVASQKYEGANQDFVKQFQQRSVKPNLNAYLKQHEASFSHGVSSMSAITSKSANLAANAKVADISRNQNTFADSAIGKLITQQRVGRRGKKPAKKLKAKFDPITKKYVSTASIAANTLVVPAPASTSLPTSSSVNLTENLKKFNASALSIQSKVQQIDSVLSSLNAAKSAQPVTKQIANGHIERKVKSSRSASTSVETPIVATSGQFSVAQTTTSVAATSPESGSGTVHTKTSPAASPRGKQPKRQKATSGKQSKTTPKKAETQTPASAASKPPESSSVSTSVPSSSGTVHWNQTTTAGPQITTTTLTVPVYITGTIPTGAWPAVSISGATLPMLLPAHKISPHCQLPQRVLLGSIGSLAVRSQVVTSPSTPLKPTRTVITPVTLPINAAGYASTMQKLPTNVPVGGMHTQQSGQSVMQNFAGILPTSTHFENVSMSVQASTTASLPVPNLCAPQEESVAKKKSARKASHDTILHDPLMYDPTALDRGLPDGS